MRRAGRWTALLAGSAAVLIVVPVVALPPGTEGYNQSGDTEADNCGMGNSLTLHHPDDLWPPNHKYYDDLYALAEDEQGGEITLESYGHHDQYDSDTGTEQNGSGNTGDDIAPDDEDATVMQGESEEGYPQPAATETGSGSVQTDWRARAERSGRDQTGREYTFGAMASFADGSCSVEVTFSVPHDMRASNRGMK